ncbi:MAG: DNA polymerase III subunit delta' [Hyphomicrobium sp.]
MARAIAIADVETLPEADRLAGFPHPRETLRLYGHETAERGLANAFAAGRMHHAWLVTGLHGTGKATLCYRLAAFLLAREGERDMFAASLDVSPEASAKRLIRAQSHPALLVIRRPYDSKSKRFRTEITVDEVRRIKSFIGLTADAGAWRVVIVDPADELNANAANALLKALEEPPAQTVFLLVSSAPGRLLPTIRSRCRTLDLAPLSGEALKKAVQQAMTASSEDVGEAAVPEPGEWPLLERLSGGSVRRALGLKASGGLDLYQRILKLLAGLPKLDWEGVHKLGDDLASPAAEQRYELFFELYLGLIARLIRSAAGGEGDGEEARLAARLIAEPNLATWAGLWETAAREKALAEALNLDRKALILDTFSRIETAARG